MTFEEPGPVSVEADDRYWSIGEVLEQLRDEFPDITISKIRFLESQGLIDPERTPSGYRKFTDDDLERLRWILVQQRDHFLPLRVIKERLDSFEGPGMPPSEPAPAPESPPSLFDEVDIDVIVDEDDDMVDGIEPVEPVVEVEVEDTATPPATTPDELTRAELLDASGLTDTQLDDLEDHGLITPTIGVGERALYDTDALEVARLAAGFHARGVEARHLKMYKHFAEREAALFGQVLMPYILQRNPEARVKLQEELEELARLGRRLRTVTLRQALRDELHE